MKLRNARCTARPSRMLACAILLVAASRPAFAQLEPIRGPIGETLGEVRLGKADDVVFINDDGDEAPDGHLGFEDGRPYIWGNLFQTGSEDTRLGSVRWWMRTESTASPEVVISMFNETTGERLVDLFPTISPSPEGRWYDVSLPLLELKAGESFSVIMAASGTIGRPAGYDVDAIVPGASYFSADGANYTNLASVQGLENAAYLIRIHAATGEEALPDLIVSSVEAPAEAFSGTTIEVEWVVRNAGTASTTASGWMDRVYLSGNDTFNPLEDLLLGEVRNAAYLGPSEGYASRGTFTLPEGISGAHHLFVWADGDTRQAELNDENNTRGAAQATSVTLTPPPDLQVTNVTAPKEAFSGQSLVVAWTVANQGLSATPTTVWRDAVYLSQDEVYDSGSDMHLNDFVHSGALAPGMSYAIEERIDLPDTLFGAHHLIVVTDFEEDVFEHVADDNNAAPAAIDISLSPPPDLVVSQVEAPAAVRSGEAIDVAWTVENAGAGATFESAWSDRIYLSPTPDLQAASAVVLGTDYHGGRLDATDSYASSRTVRLPNGIQGTYYLIVVTDWDDDVFEYPAEFELNNAGRAPAPLQIELSPWPDLQVASMTPVPAATAGDALTIEFTVSNNGTGTALATNWKDAVYVGTSLEHGDRDRLLGTSSRTASLAPSETYTSRIPVTLPPNLDGPVYLHVVAESENTVYEHSDETNNVHTQSVTISPYPPVDLALSNLSAPPTAMSGASIEVAWSARNVGDGATLAANWEDDLFLTADPNADPLSGEQIGSIRRTAALAPDESYSRREQIRIPDGLSGEYVLHVVSGLTDSDPSNSIVSSPLSIQLSPPPDLLIEAVSAPGDLTSGQPVSVGWRVLNAGTGSASAWRDGLFLSQDASLSTDDLALGSLSHEPLMEGGTRDAETTLQIPIFVSGSYNLIVAADFANQVYEHLAEANNTQTAAVQVTLAPPSDLVVDGITFPGTAEPGKEISISWSIRNDGSNPAVGEMTDAVFVSADDSWSIDDPAVGMLTRNVDIAPGAAMKVEVAADLSKTYRLSADGNLEEELPGVAPGTYYILVRTDIRNNIREALDANNAGASSGTMEIGLPALELGRPHQTTLAAGQERYVQVAVPAGRTLRVTLRSASADAFNELYVRHGDVPSRSAFDAAHESPYEADQEAWIPATLEGTYYIEARSEMSPDLQQVVLQADTISFEITGVTPSRGGNVGEVTLRVDGARLDSFTTVRLRPAGSAEPLHEPVWQRLGDPGRIYATFDLRNLPTGSYDVVALSRPVAVEVDSASGDAYIVTNTREAVLASGFSVDAGGGAVLDARLRLPDAARIGNDFPITLEVANVGNVDLPSPLLRVVSPNTTPLSPDFPVKGMGMQKIDVLVLGPDLRKDVLAPGQRTTAKFYARAAHFPGSLFWLQDADDMDPRIGRSDFEVYLDRFRPQEDPESVWRAFQELVGETPETYTEALRSAAARRNPGFGPEAFFFGEDLVQDLVARAWGESQGRTYVDFGRTFPEVVTPDGSSATGKRASVRTAVHVPSGRGCGTCEMNAGELALAEAQVRAGASLFEGLSPWSFAGELLNHFADGGGEDIYYGPNDVYTYWGGAVAEVLAHPQLQNYTKALENAIEDKIKDSGMAAGMSCGQSTTLRLDDFLDPADYQLKDRSSDGSTASAGLDFNGESRGLSLGVGGIHSARYTGTATVTKGCSCNGCCESVDVTTDIQIFLKDVYDFCPATADVSNPAKKYITYLVEQLEVCGWAKEFDLIIEAPIPPKTIQLDCGQSGGSESDPPCCKNRDPANERFCTPPDVNTNDGCGDCPPPFAPLVVSGSGNPQSTGNVPSVQSCDPNDMLGPAGYGDDKWISVSQTLPYTIRFENDPVLATAAAQVVAVSHALDDTVDPRTFRLGPFGFGPFEFDVPENTSFFSQRFDVRDSLGYYVDATAGVDVVSNEAFWVFRTIDPVTGSAPADPRSGFLAVNDSLHSGEGFVTYSVRPKPTALTRDRIDVKASIFFDENAPIDTPPLFNTVDSEAPVSTLSYVASDDAGLHLLFAAEDEGSGVREYALYVSTDGGPFQLHQPGLSGPTAVFVPEPGRRYRAFSIATDHAGNVEGMKSHAQSIVVATEDNVELPASFAVFPNYPNPFNPSTTVPFDLPVAAEVDVLVYNLLGQRVERLELGRLNPGRHQQRIDLTGLASGVYFYEFTARGDGEVLFRDVRRFVLVK